MNSRFRVIDTARSYAAKFSRRIQKPGETAEEYAADLKRLYDKAHGYRDRRTRDEDLVRRFLDGLYDEEVRLEVEFNKEPQNIDEAVYHVVNLIQIRNASRGEKKGRFHVRRARDENNREEDWAYKVDESNTQSKSGWGKGHHEPKTKADKSADKVIQEIQLRIEKLESQRDTVLRRKQDKGPMLPVSAERALCQRVPRQR